MFGLLAAAVSLLRGMLGVGILSMPYMFTRCGSVCAFILLGVFACNACIMSTALAFAGKEVTSYEETVRKVLGQRTERFLAANILLANTGSCAALLDVAGNLTCGALEFWNLRNAWSYRGAIIVAYCLAIFPMTATAKFRGTLAPSLISLLLAVAISVSIAVISIHGGQGPETGHSTFSSVLQSLPLSCYAFSAMSQVFPTYSEFPQEQRRPKSIARAAAIAACVAFMLYGVVGFSAARHFGNSTKSDILENFEASRTSFAYCIVFSFSVICLLGVPLNLFPARRSLNFLVAGGDDGMEPKYLMAGSAVLLVAACAIAAFARSILVILDIVGSASAIAVDTVLPGILFLKASSSQIVSPLDEEVRTSLIQQVNPLCWQRWILMCMVLAGVVAGSASFVHTVSLAASR